MIFKDISRIQFLIERKKYDEAQLSLAEAFTSNPDSPDLHALQAQIFFNQDQYKNALNSINNAIGMAPENDFLHFWKARILAELNQGKKALECMDEALRLDPQDADYYGFKALLLSNREKRKEAVEVAREGLEKDPDNALCKNALSVALQTSGKTAESATVLEGLLEKDPEDPFTQANTGYNYLRSGDIKKAKEHFRVALMLDPNNEYTRAGMVEAMKASNFFYRKILEYYVRMERLSSGKRWAITIGMILIVKILPFLLPIYLVFLLWVWFAPPIAQMVLYFDKSGRYLMDKQARMLTDINLTLTGVSLVSLALAPLLSLSFLGLAFGAFAAIVPVHMIEYREKKRNRVIMAGFAALFVGLGAAGVTFSMMAQPAMPLWLGLIGSVLAFTWLANVFAD